MQQGMKHSSWAISPVNGIHYLAFPICHSLKRKPKQVGKKKNNCRRISSVMCFILSNLLLVVLFIKRSSAVASTTCGRSSMLLIDLWWASNKAELDFTWCIKKAVWNQSNQSGWMISAYGRPNRKQQSQTKSDCVAVVVKNIKTCNRKSS